MKTASNFTNGQTFRGMADKQAKNLQAGFL
jgi:hypothetical protein